MVETVGEIKSWLVKSGDRVLGPFTTEALAQLIREKEVVVIDEVMKPQSRWAYIRDVVEFQAVVEEIRSGLMHSREDTEVQGYTGTQRTEPARSSNVPAAKMPGAAQTGAPDDDDNDPTIVTSAETVTATLPNLNGEQTATKTSPVIPGMGSVHPAANDKNKTPDASSSKPSAPALVPPPAATPTLSKKLAMDPLPHHNAEAQKEASGKQYVRPNRGGGKSSIIIGAAVLILAAVFVIYTVMKSPQTTRVASTSSGDLQNQASVAWKRGEFDRALEFYRALNHEQPTEPVVAARLAILMMKIEGQTVEAKRVIESAAPDAKTDEQKSMLALASGLASLQNEDAKDAVEHFKAAGPSWLAQFDQGIAQSTLKNWKDAATAFENAGDEAVALLMLARTHLSAGENDTVAKVAARKQADEAIRKALISSPDFHQEALVVAAYIDQQAGNTKRSAKEILEAVESDPNQTADHFHDPSLSLEMVSWAKLLPYCEGLQNNTEIASALMAICLAKANQLEQAGKIIGTELTKSPTNTHLHAVAAYLHTLSDRDDAARASITLSTKSGNSRLAQILSARICMREKQDDCAEDAWSKLAGEQNAPVAAMTGLALLRQQKGDTDAANALMVKAEQMSPRYLPLLRLREDVSK